MILQGMIFIVLAILLLYFPPADKIISAILVLIFSIAGVALIVLRIVDKKADTKVEE